MTTVLLSLACIFIALASKQIGQYLAALKLPLITGYLLVGVVVGPFILGWISADAVKDLRIIDEISLAFIGFAAGSELYLKELRSRFRSIAWVTAGLVLSTFTLGSAAVFVLADFIPFLREMPTVSKAAVAIMGGAILVARSPSSAIAIINELRARGPYTKTALGVTVVMDAVVILLFSINSSLADTLLTSAGFDPLQVLLVVGELLLALAAGYVVGKLLQLLTSAQANARLKAVLILLTGLGVYLFSAELRAAGKLHLDYEVMLEPLLVCMIGGFVVTNLSRFRDEFLQIIQDIGPAIYIVFFTLTGASLALDTLAEIWVIALALFGVRLVAIMLGSFSGSMIAGESLRHGRLSWMAYITQAGIGLGLAKEVAVEFPAFGNEFATLFIAIIVLNQIIGPPLFKFAIKRLGESHLPGLARPNEIRDALILGIDDQSLALARQLKEHNWKVIMADIDQSHVERLAAEDVEERFIPELNHDTLASMVTNSTDALVAMLGDDQANFEACELAFEKFGIPRLIVRLNDLTWSDKFHIIGALVVEPASAMVNLLDQFVRAPQSAAMLLHRDPEHEVIQITITDPDIAGLPLRELRLPIDVRVLGLIRHGHSIVPHGHTILHLQDEVTLVGQTRSLEEVTVRWGF